MYDSRPPFVDVTVAKKNRKNTRKHVVTGPIDDDIVLVLFFNILCDL